jgi:hypothetical protein
MLLKSFTPVYDWTNKLITQFRSFVQLKLYTKRILAGWLVLLFLGQIFSEFFLLWLATVAMFVIPAAKKFGGVDFGQLVEMSLEKAQELKEMMKKFVPRASSCRQDD